MKTGHDRFNYSYMFSGSKVVLYSTYARLTVTFIFVSESVSIDFKEKVLRVFLYVWSTYTVWSAAVSWDN